MCLVLAGFTTGAIAADLDAANLRGPMEAPPPALAWSWTGFYFGGQIGGGAAIANFSDPFGSSIFGDTVAAPSFLAGGQVGYNWELPNSSWVLGVEADLNWLNSDGTNTCLAVSGLFVSANCRTRPNMMADLTARVGWTYGYANHSMLYAKGGAALVHNQVDITTNATTNFIGLAPQVTSIGYNALGWTIGAGVEHAVTPAWSLVVEYDYVGLGTKTITTPQGLVQAAPPLPFYFLTPASATQVSQSFQVAKLGLNYKIGVDPGAQWSPAAAAFPVKTSVASDFSNWEIETGVRYFRSAGKFQKDLGGTTDPAQSNILVSRLSYGATANSGELFGRIEAPQNIFVKGNIGAGSISSGQLNDEDWVLFGGTVPYSNTASAVGGNLNYATVDLGYDVIRDASAYRLGVFAGYNYYKEDETAYGCTQIANPVSDCVPSIPTSFQVISENDLWQSVRVGLNGRIMIADRLRLEADVAYLPYVTFGGTDNHVLRALTIQESGVGTGLQVEGILSYLINDQFSFGAGGRYWSMWTTSGAIADFAGAPCPCQTQPAKAQLYGVFVQAAYTFPDRLF
jgi:opacity protein-like surface antigen/outer membrane protease